MRSGLRRVVVTGAGCVTPIGNTLETAWRSALEGKSGAEEITLLDHSGLGVHFAGEVKKFTPDDHMDVKLAKRTARFTQFALASAKAAIPAAVSKAFEPDRTGVVYASGVGGVRIIEEQYDVFEKKGIRRLSAIGLPVLMINNAPARLAIEFGFTGPNYAVAASCAGSLYAIGMAFRHIQLGEADTMLAGGAEAAVSFLVLAGLDRMRCLSRRNEAPAAASRPFDKERDGIVIGEGAGSLLLEDLDHALARGASILAEIKGVGFACDGAEATATGSGITLAMLQALKNSGLSSSDIDYISANGSSSRSEDLGEARAIRRVFGEIGDMPIISSTKGQTGHLLGAAGAVETVFTIMAVKERTIPPTINYHIPDPECVLNIVHGGPAKREIRHALVNNFGFGGHCASICLGKFQ